MAKPAGFAARIESAVRVKRIARIASLLHCSHLLEFVGYWNSAAYIRAFEALANRSRSLDIGV
jgi:hypothetical protein